MAKQATVLFGAGASMDAGLPGSFALTQQVYDKLVAAKSPDARLFGIIIAKLQLRGARQGNDPFSSINVEEVYDALKKFIGRNDDVLSEFVQSWEDLAGSADVEFDAQKFLNSISSGYQLSDRRSLDGRPHLHVNGHELAKATEILSRAFHGEFYRFRGASLEPFLQTLSSLLEISDDKTGYMRRFLEANASRISCLATLNYDRLVEQSFEYQGKPFDLGLSQWNDKRFVRFHGQSPKLIKLHGSIDWFIKGQDEIVVNKEGPYAGFPRRAMIFGGQDSKLVPFGPFLQLRHEFQKFLRGPNKLLVAGYSFGDEHLNAILRSWIATRRSAKMMVVDPSGFDPKHPIMESARARDKSGKVSEKVTLEVVEKPFSEAESEVDRFLAA